MECFQRYWTQLLSLRGLSDEKKLQKIINYFALEEGYSKKDLITDWLGEIKELKGYSANEIGLEWDGEYLMTLDDFVTIFYELVINEFVML